MTLYERIVWTLFIKMQKYRGYDIFELIEDQEGDCEKIVFERSEQPMFIEVEDL